MKAYIRHKMLFFSYSRIRKRKRWFYRDQIDVAPFFHKMQINIRSLITIWIGLKISDDAHSMQSSVRFKVDFGFSFFFRSGICTIDFVYAIPPQKVACSFTLSNCFYVCMKFFMIKSKQAKQQPKIEDKYDLHGNGLNNVRWAVNRRYSLCVCGVMCAEFKRFIIYSGHA